MQVLAREFDALDAAPPAFQRVSEDVGIGEPERPLGIGEPLVIERAEARGGCQAQVLVVPGVRRLRVGFDESAPLPEHLLDHGDVAPMDRPHQVLARRVQIAVTRLRERLREQQPDGPAAQMTQQRNVPKEKQPEVPWDGRRHEEDEDVMVAARSGVPAWRAF
mgnify:CR=1 FL=1